MDSRGSKELAKEYYETAVSNLSAAKSLFRDKFFPEAVFFAQQAVEKIAKAILILTGQTVSGHEVSGWLALEIADKLDNPREIIQIVSELESYVSKARYPFRIRDRIISPRDFFNEKKTKEIIKKAEYAFDILKTVLTTKYNFVL